MDQKQEFGYYITKMVTYENNVYFGNVTRKTKIHEHEKYMP